MVAVGTMGACACWWSRTRSDWRTPIARGLQAEGFDVDVVHDGLDGLWRAREGRYGAIVLDILLPGMNGYQVCRDAARRRQIWTPILMLTAKDGEYDEAEALDTGADDFLSKPFSFVGARRAPAGAARRAERAPAGGAPGRRRWRSIPAPHVHTSRTCPSSSRPRVRGARGAHAARARTWSPKAELLDEVWGCDVDRRPQRRGGLRRLPAPQDRRAVRLPDARQTVRGVGYRLVSDG